MERVLLSNNYLLTVQVSETSNQFRYQCTMIQDLGRLLSNFKFQRRAFRAVDWSIRAGGRAELSSASSASATGRGLGRAEFHFLGQLGQPSASSASSANSASSASSASSAKVLSQLRQLYTYTLHLHPTPYTTTHYPLPTTNFCISFHCRRAGHDDRRWT